jgi:L-ornithine Nalpha-acyltransferase
MQQLPERRCSRVVARDVQWPFAMKQNIVCRTAVTKRQLDDAVRVRWEVFSHERGYVEENTPRVSRELDRRDTRESTVHIVAYAGEEPIGTARLLLANPDVARRNRQKFGLDLEVKFDLSAFDQPGVVAAETTRVCVAAGFRRMGVFELLYAALREESLARGVTHWVACANTDTDSLEDACIAHLVAARMGLVSNEWAISAKKEHAAPREPRSPFYTPEERERAARGDLRGLRLPPTLLVYARKGARFIGRPIFDPRFHMCSMPLVVEFLQDQDASRGWHEAA